MHLMLVLIVFFAAVAGLLGVMYRLESSLDARPAPVSSEDLPTAADTEPGD